MDRNHFNEILWIAPNSLGWWFWIWLVPLGIWGIVRLYQLAAPETKMGAWARLIMFNGFLCLVATVFFNGLGPYAIYLLAIGGCLIGEQTYRHCLKAGKIKAPQSSTFVERMTERVISRQ